MQGYGTVSKYVRAIFPSSLLTTSKLGAPRDVGDLQGIYGEVVFQDPKGSFCETDARKHI